MINRASIACAALVLALASGCSRAPTIDSSSPESVAKSIEQIQAALPEAKREAFSEALAVVIATALGGGYKDVGDTPEGRARVRAALDGKTADDVIAAAAKIRLEAAAAPAKDS